MIAQLFRGFLGRGGKVTPAPQPVRMDDLFAGSDAAEYDEQGGFRPSTIVIAPRIAEADFANLEASLPPVALPPTDRFPIPGTKSYPTGTAPADDDDRGWGGLNFGD